MNLLKKIKEDFESFSYWIEEALLFERGFLSFLYIALAILNGLICISRLLLGIL